MSVADVSLQLTDEQATVDFGQRCAKALRGGGGVMFLLGQLGAGKTTFTRGLLRGLGHSGSVKSPTYTLVEPYDIQGQKVFHFDLYRLGDPEELEYMGIRDYFLDQNICIVEWPERGDGILPVEDLRIELIVSGTGRKATLRASTEKGHDILQSILTQN
jgi:tRNA threonylcarbamoyladenosine biosynthesis protein TsaE